MSEVNKQALKRANESLEEVGSLLHPNAKAELTENIARARAWLMGRFTTLPGLCPETSINPQLNAWNQTHGLGLQSVSVVAQNGDEILLLPHEWKSPTIGVIAPGLLEGDDAQYAEVDFPIDQNDEEAILNLSVARLYMHRISKKHGHRIDNTEWMKSEEYMRVFGHVGGAVRTILEMKNPDPQKIREIMNHGIYGCQFRRWN